MGGMRPGSGLWKEKDDGVERDRRAMSRGKVAKGSMFRNKPQGVYKAKIAELVDQLEENNQTILLQRLQITSLREEFLAAQHETEMQRGSESDER